MGLANLSHITTALMENGMSADMPVAVIQEGTTARQRTVTGTLSTISDLVVQQYIQAPATIVVGKVVTLREQLQWFEPGKNCSESGFLLLEHHRIADIFRNIFSNMVQKQWKSA